MAVYRTVITGTDGSATATEAVQRAALLAAGLGAPLLVAAVFTRPKPEDFGPPSQRAEMPRESWLSASYRAAAETVADAAGLARTVAGTDLDVDTVTPEGEPADMLLAEAERRPGSLLVVGNQGMTGSQRFLLGSVPNKISHHAVGDVLIVRTGTQRAVEAPRRFLVATDGSETATRAVLRGAQVAAALGADVTIVTVDDNAGRARGTLDAALAVAEEAGVTATTQHRTGHAAEQIIEAEKGHDVVVVGNRGMTGAARFMLGNVPNRVSHHSETDLLIVSTDAEAFSGREGE